MKKHPIHWVTLSIEGGKKFPLWLRTVGIDPESKAVYIAAGMAGDEDKIVLCTMFDGTPVVAYKNHSYVPAEWMAKEFPEARETCESILRRRDELLALTA